MKSTEAGMSYLAISSKLQSKEKYQCVMAAWNFTALKISCLDIKHSCLWMKQYTWWLSQHTKHCWKQLLFYWPSMKAVPGHHTDTELPFATPTYETAHVTITHTFISWLSSNDGQRQEEKPAHKQHMKFIYKNEDTWKPRIRPASLWSVYASWTRCSLCCFPAIHHSQRLPA